jgi:capsular polysaccharide transport system permease protein
VERARRLSDALSEAARRARFSSRSRRRLGGYRDHPSDRLFKAFAILSFILIAAIPSATCFVYFAFVATDQFEARFKFAVARAESPEPDTFGAVSGMPALAILQDTQIVVNHLDSRAAVEALDRTLNLREKYSSMDVDWFARFSADEPIEKFVRYWRSKVEASVTMPSALVQVRVRAFSASDALDISKALVEMSETLVNDLNDRMNRDTIAQAQVELSRAGERLREARIALQKARNEAGLLDALTAAQGTNQLINETQSALLKLEGEYVTQIRSVSPEAPQIISLRARIDGVRRQLIDLRAKVASQNPINDDPTYSALMTRFSELELERQIAERLYAAAFASLERARFVAEAKRMYLNVFIQPTLPEESEYPKRVLYICLGVLGALGMWLGVVAGGSLVRNHMG